MRNRPKAFLRFRATLCKNLPCTRRMEVPCGNRRTARIGLFGLAALFWLHATVIAAATLYVSQSSLLPVPPYTTWETAAHTIQDAIDMAEEGDEIVVTNGVYATGGKVLHERLTNRVAITTGITVRSVNGSE